MGGESLTGALEKAKRHIVPAAAVFFGIAITWMAFAMVSSWEREVLKVSFEQAAKNRIETIQREIDFDLQLLLSLKAFYDSSDEVDRSEFRTFTHPLLSLHPSVQAVEWIPRVPRDDRSRCEAAALADGLPDFRITERDAQGKMQSASERPEYYPVYFVEPYKGNEVALGFDLGSNAVRRKALEEARDRGAMVASGRVTLVQETTGQYGALVFAPVYRKGLADNLADSPRDALQGFVLGAFRIGNMVEQSLSYLTPEGIDLTLHDQSAPEAESLLCSRLSPPTAAAPGFINRLLPEISFEYAGNLQFADRGWRITLRSTPDFAALRRSTHPWEILAGGLLLTALLAGYLIVHKRNEDALRESEEKYRQLFDMESDAVFLVDAARDRLLDVNSAGSVLYGYTREELFQMKRTDLMAEGEDPGGVMPHEGPSVHLRRRKNGTVFPVEITSRNFTWKGREVYVAAVRDITERRRVEETLHTSHQLYARAELMGSFGHWDRDLLTNVSTWSAGMYPIFGISPDAFDGSFDGFLGFVHPLDRETVREKYAQAISRGSGFELEFRTIRPDGDERMMHAVGELRVDETGRPVGAFGITRDVTEERRTARLLKEGESRYRSLFKNNHAVMLLMNPETGAIVDANPAACVFYGYRYNELRKLTIMNINTLPAERVKEELENARTERRNRFNFRHRLADGSIRDVQVFCGPIVVSGKKLLYSIINDVTERKRAEDELRQANEYLENIFQNSPDGIGIVDRDGRFFKWNRMAAEQYGYSFEELEGLRAFDFYADKSELDTMLAKLRRHGAIRRHAMNMKKKDGSVATFEISISLLRDGAGETMGSVCVARDMSDIQKALKALEASNERLQQEIAERKRVAETLRESERRFREVLENIHLLAVSLDVEGRITFCNDFLLDVTGWGRDEVLGHDWFSVFAPRERRQAGRRAYLDEVTGGEIEIHGEEEIVTCFGKTNLISWDNTLLRDPQGKVTGVTKIGRDIGLRRKMERELREASAEMELLIASIPSILVELSGENRVIRWNSAAERILGVPAEDVMGMPFHECALQWDWKRMSEGLAACLQQGAPLRLHDVGFVRPDGKERLLGLVISPIKNELDEQKGSLILGSDNTDRRLLERQLAQAQKLESIGQLAAGIAHEINTPTQYVGDNTRFLLNAFTDLEELLDRYAAVPEDIRAGKPIDDLVREMAEVEEKADLEYLREEIPKAIRQSLEGVERVSKIVGAMKEFSHPGTTEKAAIDINRAIESTITVARNEWKYLAEMVTDFDPAMPLIFCLPGEFNQVTLNMIINAAHAISETLAGDRERKGTIAISTRNLGDRAEIRISDTGSGIPEEIRSRIFDPFFTTKEVGKGTGQGLAIAHSVIVDKHGGTIDFETETGKGTTFIIHLPIVSLEGLRGDAK